MQSGYSIWFGYDPWKAGQAYHRCVCNKTCSLNNGTNAQHGLLNTFTCWEICGAANHCRPDVWRSKTYTSANWVMLAASICMSICTENAAQERHASQLTWWTCQARSRRTSVFFFHKWMKNKVLTGQVPQHENDLPIMQNSNSFWCRICAVNTMSLTVYLTVHDMTWHDMTWHDMTWHDMTWQDMTWHDMT